MIELLLILLLLIINSTMSKSIKFLIFQYPDKAKVLILIKIIYFLISIFILTKDKGYKEVLIINLLLSAISLIHNLHFIITIKKISKIKSFNELSSENFNLKKLFKEKRNIKKEIMKRWNND